MPHKSHCRLFRPKNVQRFSVELNRGLNLMLLRVKGVCPEEMVNISGLVELIVVVELTGTDCSLLWKENVPQLLNLPDNAVTSGGSRISRWGSTHFVGGMSTANMDAFKTRMPFSRRPTFHLLIESQTLKI